MEPPAQSDELRLISSQGPLSRDEASLLLDRGAELLAAGEFAAAFQHYRRVIGFDDPNVTAAALLGAGQARYRFDDEAGAVATWEAILELPETPSTYAAYREIAAARVRDGDLQGAIAAYREADRRAPEADKAEIANRLGWLAKETGNVRASRRYFARGRGAVIPVVTYGLMALTIAVSLTAIIASEGELIFRALELNKWGLVDGELWRLVTVTLVHGGVAVSSVPPDEATNVLIAGLLHLGFNMYALYLCGPLVEQIYGPAKMLAVYVLAAIGGSIASFAFSESPLGVGASGAIFGLFGLLFAASRMHLPLLDRRGRAVLSQVGFLIVINIVIGFGLTSVDNLAHLGGLATGLLLGVILAPTRVQTMGSRWQTPDGSPIARGLFGRQAVTIAAIIVLVAGLIIGFAIGYATWVNEPRLPV
jgi:membrane associated rhomboid family serine protease